MKQLGSLLTCVLLSVLAAPSTARQLALDSPAAESMSVEEAVETFEYAWRVVYESHFDEAFNGVDWVALREEMLPRVREVRDVGALRALLTEMIRTLGQSHFALLPREVRQDSVDHGQPSSKDGGFGFDVRYREAALLVSRLDPGGPAERAGVQGGWQLVSVGDVRVEELAERSVSTDSRHVASELRDRVRLRLFGAIGTTDQLGFLDAQGQAVSLQLERDERNVVVHNVGNLPTFHLRFDAQQIEKDGRTLGVIHFSNWFVPMVEPLHRAIDEMRGCDGLVIDLRGNSGGSGPMIMGFAGHFFDERRDLGVQIMRGSTMRFIALPQRVSAIGEPVDAFDGPLAILLDETTGSASEVFAGGMQSVGRARVFGETSAGAVLPGRTTSLPNGDSLLHAIGDFRTAQGTQLEGRGVVPDETVPLERESLLAGRDPQLERALEWLVSADQ